MKKNILLGLGFVILIGSLLFYMYDQSKYTTFETVLSDLQNKMDDSDKFSSLRILYFPTKEEYEQGQDIKFVRIEDEEQIQRIFHRIVEETANMEVKEIKKSEGSFKLMMVFRTSNYKKYYIYTTDNNSVSIVSDGVKKDYKISKNDGLQKVIDSENLDWRNEPY